MKDTAKFCERNSASKTNTDECSDITIAINKHKIEKTKGFHRVKTLKSTVETQPENQSNKTQNNAKKQKNFNRT